VKWLKFAVIGLKALTDICCTVLSDQEKETSEAPVEPSEFDNSPKVTEDDEELDNG
jgi:hypothetical protein